jgi:carboxyl-terminal processing protease
MERRLQQPGRVMVGKIASVVVLGTLLAPLHVAAQNGDRLSSRANRESTAATDEAQVFMQTFQTIRDYYIEAVGDSALWEKAIDGLIQELGDPYATVFTPDDLAQFREETTGNYAGIGVQISNLNASIAITIVFSGTPADDVGLLVGDRIVGVNGESTEGWTTADASDRIRGEPGTNVEVTIARDGALEPIRYSIRRDNVHVESVHADVVHDRFGYIVVDRVSRGATVEVDRALTELEDSEGVILDLRRNPGGYLDESLQLADLFLEPGSKLASTRSRSIGRDQTRSEESWDARLPARMPETPVIILVDRFTASAAEIITGALQDHDRALVLGERTFGKGVVQTLLPLPAGRQMRLTTGEWYTPLGRSLHRPRNLDGEPTEDETAERPTFTTSGGRTIQGGGGVFPDLPIRDDTLTLAERDLFSAAGRAEVPINLRIAEFALAVAKDALTRNAPPLVTRVEFDGFVQGLVEEGLPIEALEAEGVEDYLFWRTRIAAAERADDIGLAAEHRTERDPVLARAIELLQEARTQAELFAVAKAQPGAETTGVGVSGTHR